VAILLVLGRHWPHVPVASPDLLFGSWRRGGWVGVDVFFVLSGFLVGGLFFREFARYGRLDVPRFLVRRGFKIYPAYYLLLVVSALTGMGSQTPTLRSILCEAFYLQNYLAGHWIHTWSLAVEEHFYLVLPVVLVVLLRRGNAEAPFRGLGVVTALVVGGCLLLRWSQAGQAPVREFLISTHLRIDSLVWGTFVAWHYHARPEWFHGLGLPVRVGLALAGVGLLAPSFVLTLGYGDYLPTLGLTANTLGSSCLLVAVLPARFPGQVWGAVAAIGRNSYSIYLWHIAVGFAVSRLCALQPTRLPPVGWIALYLGLSIAAGFAGTHLVELPLLRLRDRLFPSRSGALPERAEAELTP